MSDRPRLLPLLGATRHGSRDAMTCLYRCGNACDHPVPNTSDNPYLGDIVDAEVSRRGVVRAGAVAGVQHLAHRPGELPDRRHPDRQHRR
ncbi:hypothetical protein AB0C00_26145, partial [Micromonospora carbonacea]